MNPQTSGNTYGVVLLALLLLPAVGLSAATRPNIVLMLADAPDWSAEAPRGN